MSTTINKKYIFIMNSTKPTKEEYESLEDIRINNFSRPCLLAAYELGYEVVLGINRKYAKQLKCKEMPYLKFYNSHTYRNIFAFKDNYRAYRNLCNELKKGGVDVIHCNTPIGGVVGRLGGHKYKIRKLIYTAHGFHFFKGASFFNNTVIKFVERLLAHWTDIIITMNEEDYFAAKKMKLKKNGKVYKVNGVGIDTALFINKNNCDKEKKRKELGLNIGDFICISIGDLVKRKNYSTLIKAVKKTNDSRIHCLICGVGPEFNNLKKLIEELQLENQIHLLGYRNDIQELLEISDCFVFSSLQEGLPRSTMEAMASGLPCIVSKVRGNVDLIDPDGGILVEKQNSSSFACAIKTIRQDTHLCESMGNYNQNKIKYYDFENILHNISEIYSELGI